jgi:hypothetical protein
MSLRDEIAAILDEPTRDDPARLEAEVFGDANEVQKLAPMDALRLSLLLVHGAREALLRLAEEVDKLRLSGGGRQH